MSIVKLDEWQHTPHPIDVVEQVITHRDMPFDRVADNELVAEHLGHWSDIRIWCSWQEDAGAMLFSFAYGAKVPDRITKEIYHLLALVNERVMAGHFDLCHDESMVHFRNTLLYIPGEIPHEQHIGRMLELGIKECERFYPALQSAIWGGKTAPEALEIAMFDTIGEA